MHEYDLVIIGAGPGGYVAAIRAAQLGLKTAVVEKHKQPGGTCLNWGCIPTKSLLHAGDMLNLTRHAGTYGVTVGDITLDLKKVMKNKQSAVRRLSAGVAGLLKQNGVTLYAGHAVITTPGTVVVEQKDGREKLRGKSVILANGSEPAALPHVPFDGTNIVSSTEAIAFDEVPGTLLVVGAGAVGLELGLTWHRFGSKVTVVEILPNVLPGADVEVSKALEKSLKKEGLEILTRTSLDAAEVHGESVQAKLKEADGKTSERKFDKVLVSIGRKASLDGIDAVKLGLKVEKGRIPVDAAGRTNVAGVYAIGDVVPGAQLAHLASAEGIRTVEAIAGLKHTSIDQAHVPACTYTDPEVASVGLSEEQAKERGYEIKIGRFPFMASGKAMIEGNQNGFVKLIADKKYDQILGVHMIGPHATELIAEATLALQLECTCEELAHTIHAHPTLSESMGETGHDSLDGAIHFYTKKK